MNPRNGSGPVWSVCVHLPELSLLQLVARAAHGVEHGELVARPHAAQRLGRPTYSYSTNQSQVNT